MRMTHKSRLAPLLAALAVLALVAVSGCDFSGAATRVDAPNKPATPPSDAAHNSAPAEPTAAESTASSSGRPAEKTFDDIVFDIEPDEPFERSMLTPEIEHLSGDRIRIRGYILPTAQKRGIKQFVLVRDNMECCFGPGAALYDCILVTMQKGSTAEFSIRPVAVTGTFEIEEFKGPDGKHLAVFQLHGEEVR